MNYQSFFTQEALNQNFSGNYKRILSPIFWLGIKLMTIIVNILISVDLEKLESSR